MGPCRSFEFLSLVPGERQRRHVGDAVDRR